MACCIEDLLAQPLGDFDWLKDFNCSPLEDRGPLCRNATCKGTEYTFWPPDSTTSRAKDGPILDGRPKPLRPNFLAINTPEEGRETVRRLKSGGADFIKVYSWLSRDSFLAIVDEAKKQNIPFAGHVPFSVSALEASDAGQKSMEYLWGIYLSCSSHEEELRSEMLKGGVNLPGSERIRLELDEAAASYDERKAAKVFAHLAKNETWMVPTFTAVLRDSEIFSVRVTTDSRLKYIPPAIQKQWTEAASAGAAIKSKSFDRKIQVVGRYAPSRCPLEDIRNTQKIDSVVLKGRLLMRGDLDNLLAHVATWASNASGPSS